MFLSFVTLFQSFWEIVMEYERGEKCKTNICFNSFIKEFTQQI